MHIADVSYFVKEGSALDSEAKSRATSVYLVQKVIPMLPPVLCEQLCSLNPNVDRLAFSCIWRMRADGSLCDSAPWFGRTIVRSCAKLDYPTAQRMIDGIIPSSASVGVEDVEDAFFAAIPAEIWEHRRRPVGHSAWMVSRDVCLMNGIAMQRRTKRLSHGALVLHKKKLVFRLDSQGNPDSVGAYTIRDSNKLVEEYMLLANYLTAQELLNRVNKAAFLRNHRPPKLKELSDLESVCKHINVPMDTSSAATLQTSLQALSLRTDDDVELLQEVVTACLTHPMQMALYIAAGKVFTVFCSTSPLHFLPNC